MTDHRKSLKVGTRVFLCRAACRRNRLNTIRFEQIGTIIETLPDGNWYIVQWHLDNISREYHYNELALC